MKKQNWEFANRLTSHDELLIGMRKFRNIVEESSFTYEWVDLGLPSGTLWASTNIGATKPEEYGLYFAWGETEGYEDTTIDKQFTWNDYEFGTQDDLTKYNVTDGLSQLELVDDIAYQSDNTCRMPTHADLEELKNNTTNTWETLNGVNGVRFTSNTNGNSIFVPAAGYYNEGSVTHVGSCGYLWSNSLYEGSPTSAWYMGLNHLYGTLNIIVPYQCARCSGYSVRAVKSIN